VDLQTLAIALFISCTLQAAALAAQWRIAARDQGGGWWTAGVVAVTLGFGAMMLRSVPGFTSLGVFGNNVLFVSGHLLLYAGVRRFFEMPMPWRPMAALALVYACGSAWFTFGYNHLVWRGSLLYATIAGLSFLTAITLWRQHPPMVRVTARFLALTFGVHGLIFVAGLILGLVAPPDSNSPTAGPNPGQLIALLDGLIVITLWTFGFILMVNQRLSAGYREARDERALILEGTPDAVVLTRLNDGLLVEANAAFTEVLGYDRATSLGRSTTELGLWADPADRDRLVDLLRSTGRCSGLEFTFRCQDGHPIIGAVSARKLDLRGVAHLLAVIHDVSERRQMLQQMERLASTDPLTGLLNRRRFMALAHYEMRRSARMGQPLCLALVDIDRFKQINDVHGHAAGDAALKRLAELCQRHLRAIDLVARMGGDEFALLLPQTPAESGLTVLQRLHDALAQDDTPPRLTLSIGLVEWTTSPADRTAQAGKRQAKPVATDPVEPTARREGPVEVDAQDEEATLDPALQALFARADQALYEVKRAGRNGTRLG